MSFILEALRKSEAERRAAPTTRGATSGVYVVTQPRRRPLSVMMLPAAALVAGIGIAVGWNVLTRDEAPVAAPQPTAQAASGDMTQTAVPPERIAPGTPAKVVQGAPATQRKISDVSMPAAVAVVRPPVKTVVAASAAADVGGANKGSAPQVVGTAGVAKSVVVATSAPVRSGMPVHTVAPAPAAASPVAPVTQSAPIAHVAPPAMPVVAAAAPAPTSIAVAVPPPPVASPATTPPTVAAGASTVAAKTPAAPAAPSAPVVPVVAEELPKLTISGFANSDDTRSRFAVIDNRIVREGEAFAPDLRLVQVGDDGVVVEYKGRRYRP